MNLWDEWLARESFETRERRAVKLLTRIRKEDTELWERIQEFTRRQANGTSRHGRVALSVDEFTTKDRTAGDCDDKGSQK